MKKRVKTISLLLLAVMSACIVLQACEEENSEVIKSEVINDETEYSETVNSESDFEETVYCEVDWHSLLQIPKEDFITRAFSWRGKNVLKRNLDICLNG